MALGHSLFSDFAPKKQGRAKREHFLPEANAELEIEAANDMTDGSMVRVPQNIDDPSTHPQLMFRRKPGRPKIDKESGGHIVFQNSELTVVNKPTKIKGEIVDPQDESSVAAIHSKDISIVPIIKSVTTKDLTRNYNLPSETTITSFGQDKSFGGVHNLKQEDNSAYPIDDMLEVHHVEEYIPEIYDGPDGRRRGRKPKTERSTYSEMKMTLSEPYAVGANNANNGPSLISVKKIEDLLEIPTRKPTLQDFSYPELTVVSATPSNNNSRLNPLATQMPQRTLNRRIRGNRLSGSKPTYAELSESSNDAPETVDRSHTKSRKAHSKQQKKATSKLHWTEQWKANLITAKSQSGPDASSDAKKIVAPEPTSKLSAAPKETTQALPITQPTASGTPKTDVVAHKEFNESVKEILQMRQKRVPKLKYSSYDFKVRRDPNKPKMVLKFKKKYYKKKKNNMSASLASHDPVACGNSNVSRTLRCTPND